MSQEEDESVVQKAMEVLIEHFDTVSIMVTRHDQAVLDGTLTICVGRGNWFARYGQMKAWLEKQEEKLRMESRQE